MDSSHAMGCSLIGMALTALMVRLFWIGSPPFSTMPAKKLGLSKLLLVSTTLVLAVTGGYLLSLPVDQSSLAEHESGYRFH
jgi:hypothetical protein